MLLRTYSLIEHPAFIRFISDSRAGNGDYEELPASRIRRELPSLGSVSEIADYLSISHALIRALINKPARHYRSFPIKKRSGGERVIDAPRTFLKVVQWWILDAILSWQPVHPAAYGFAPGRSYIENARVHVGARHVLNVDIKDFFPSTKFDSIERVFSGLGYAPDVCEGLTKLTTFNEVLPQGAPTSPALSNLAFHRFDIELNDLAKDRGVIYSRYADDLTFSAQERIDISILAEISAIISKAGYILNDKKTKFMGVNQHQEVTGLVLGEADVGLSRHFLNSCRGWFYRVNRFPFEYIEAESKLRGTVELIRHVQGRGSDRILKLGQEAVLKVAAARAANMPL